MLHFLFRSSIRC